MGKAKSPDVVLRVVREERYATLSLLPVEEDVRLTWKACGMLSYLLTRPPGWEFYARDLVKRHREGRDAVRAGLRELRDTGYLRMLPQRGEDGKARGWFWIVVERPLDLGEWETLLATVTPPKAGFPSDGLTESGKSALELLRRGSNKTIKGDESSRENGKAKASKAPVRELWEVWKEEIAGSRDVQLTEKRRTKLRELWDEQLEGSKDPFDLFRRILAAVKRSEFHTAKFEYQLPESIFRNPERRNRWTIDAVEEVGMPWLKKLE